MVQCAMDFIWKCIHLYTYHYLYHYLYHMIHNCTIYSYHYLVVRQEATYHYFWRKAWRLGKTKWEAWSLVLRSWFRGLIVTNLAFHSFSPLCHWPVGSLSLLSGVFPSHCVVWGLSWANDCVWQDWRSVRSPLSCSFCFTKWRNRNVSWSQIDLKPRWDLVYLMGPSLLSFAKQC